MRKNIWYLRSIDCDNETHRQWIRKFASVVYEFFYEANVTIQNPIRKTASARLFFCSCGYFAL